MSSWSATRTGHCSTYRLSQKTPERRTQGMPRSLIRVKPIRKILTATEPDVMVQILRLIVLYEDLKLELNLIRLPQNKVLDEVSEHYRTTYILRRSFATLLEVDSALIQLNKHATFKRDLSKFQTNQLRDWKAAIDFFTEKKAVIKERRNAYGGHFQANVSKYILGLLDDSEESVGTLEIKRSDDHSCHYVFKFAEMLVNVGLFYGCGEQDRQEFMKENMALVTDASQHASFAIGALADHYILPTFGW